MRLGVVAGDNSPARANDIVRIERIVGKQCTRVIYARIEQALYGCGMGRTNRAQAEHREASK